MSELLQRLKQRTAVQWVLACAAAAFTLLQGLDNIEIAPRGSICRS